MGNITTKPRISNIQEVYKLIKGASTIKLESYLLVEKHKTLIQKAIYDSVHIQKSESGVIDIAVPSGVDIPIHNIPIDRITDIYVVKYNKQKATYLYIIDDKLLYILTLQRDSSIKLNYANEMDYLTESELMHKIYKRMQDRQEEQEMQEEKEEQEESQ